MKEAQPLRDPAHIDAMIEALSGAPRDLLFFISGIRLGLRVSDILTQTLGELRNKTHLDGVAKKTRKSYRLKIASDLAELAQQIGGSDDEYAFQSREGDNQPITRQQADRVLKAAQARANEILAKKRKPLIEAPVSAHTMRKTFGYHYYIESDGDIGTLMMIFGHSSAGVTLAYIGITQDKMDDAIDVISTLGSKALAKTLKKRSQAK